MTEQLSLAISERDAGITTAVDHAEAETPGWSQRALDFLRAYAIANPEFTAYMVVMASENDRNFPEPPTSRAWGGPFQKAARLGWIEDTQRTMPHPRRHASKAIVWRSRIYK